MPTKPHRSHLPQFTAYLRGEYVEAWFRLGALVGYQIPGVVLMFSLEERQCGVDQTYMCENLGKLPSASPLFRSISTPGEQGCT